MLMLTDEYLEMRMVQGVSSVMKMIKISVMAQPLFLGRFQNSISSITSRTNVSTSDGFFARILVCLRYVILLQEVDVSET
jgi:hypothetical protein